METDEKPSQLDENQPAFSGKLDELIHYHCLVHVAKCSEQTPLKHRMR